MFNYLAYKVFDYFQKEGNDKAVSKAINFLLLLEGSLIVPIFMLINNIEQHSGHLFAGDNKLKYFIIIPLFELLVLLHSTVLKKKLQGIQLSALRNKYEQQRFQLPLWIIFALPILFIFVFPVVFNGSVSIQFIERVLFEPIWI